MRTQTPAETFLAARDFLLQQRTDRETAYRQFRWPELDHFNWALDYFDPMAHGNDRPALWVVGDDGSETRLSFAQLAARSDRLANWLRGLGVVRGDRILLMLPNVPQLWDVMLAATKLGAVMIPASTLLTPTDLRDRLARGEVRHAIAWVDETPKFAELEGSFTRIAAGPGAEALTGWQDLAAGYAASAEFQPDGVTQASDTLLLYFTSGTTAQPKLVEHTHQSYPVGHLSTMYWIGLQPGDIHWNISSPGWAKHAWSNVFAPWDAGACVFLFDYRRFDAKRVLDHLVRYGVQTLCAPPTVYRMLIQEDLRAWPVKLREMVGAGEPLNPEVIERVQQAWGITIRDGYGQTETTAQIGNPPGAHIKPGSMGRPLPGYRIALLDADGQPGEEGEICLDLSARPLGLMPGYRDDPSRTAEVMREGYYHTGDVAVRDQDGYITYVGRADDVFKASDYRISPFELESVLIEHPAVGEAAIVPSPDPLRLNVPKAYVTCRAGFEPSAELARDVLGFSRQHLAPYKRVRRLEFGELPKTISGKIRRVELRAREQSRAMPLAHAPGEFWDEDFPELKRG
jgi:acetyl-CoA synthetase